MSTKKIPRKGLPVCPVRGSVVFPGVTQTIEAGREFSVTAIEYAASRGEDDRYVVVVSQKDRDELNPTVEGILRMGTVCKVLRTRAGKGVMHAQVLALARVRLSNLQREVLHSGDEGEESHDPCFFCDIVIGRSVLDVTEEDAEALVHGLRERYEQVSGTLSFTPEIKKLVELTSDLEELIDLIGHQLPLPFPEKQGLLEEMNVAKRGRQLLRYMARVVRAKAIEREVRTDAAKEIEKNQREYLLREQMKIIRKKLEQTEEGEDAPDDEAEVFRKKIAALQLPDETRKEFERELRRFSRLSAESPEAATIRNYLTLVTELPWNVTSEQHIDIKAAAELLDRDHHGLEKVKERILDFLAVQQLLQDRDAKAPKDEASEGEHKRQRGAAPILVFAGPPGVGKTSVVKSIAEAMGRKYVRVALGGVHDESEIRGHRRTYIGSMPGRILQGLRSAGTRNPVMLLDEIDKIASGPGHHGDPSSALLELLDLSQNKFFTDNYLSVPFDVSEVMFVATANELHRIPGPLRDRLEIVEFPSYIAQEKQAIARSYLLPRQIENNGLRSTQVTVSDAAIERLISHYTQEAGVRNLEREIGRMMRRVARRVAGGEIKRARIHSPEDLKRLLGQPRHVPEIHNESDMIGVATGMFYTPVGGDILFVEATATEGNRLKLTGSLGDVMKESAETALGYLRSRAEEFGLTPRHFDRQFHVHVPDGATPKDGPSAGGVLAVAMLSALVGVPVRRDVAMTGEISLTGRYMRIGGLREKVLGARRAGVRHIVLPESNLGDLDDIPAHLRRDLTFHPCKRAEEALEVAFVGGLQAVRDAAEALPIPQLPSDFSTHNASKA